MAEDRGLFHALRLLPREEVVEIWKKKKIEARCQFCSKVYSMGGPPEVRRRVDKWSGDPALDENFGDKKKS